MDSRIVPAGEIQVNNGKVKEVPFDHYPLFTAFEDIEDPGSAIKIDPLDLAKTYGAGVFLKSITLEITNERITKGLVSEVFSWWEETTVQIGVNARRNSGEPIYGLRKWNFERK